MGQVCACLEEIKEDQFSRERIQMMQQGDKFMRSIYLGLSSQELTVNLSDDCAKICWKVNGSSSNEQGEVDLTTIKQIRASGHQGLQFSGPDGKVVFDIQAEDASKRDKWMIAINELITTWETDPEKKPRSSVSSGGTSNKAEYFKNRQEEIAKREKEAAEKKAKYNIGGMKHTAQIMASRA
mmetsp:Transcript_17803/g.17880  ORF Transcript_17803/g.17880 Transcript_17803/m.17880 type:complete len:182 (-) Transcript_17803:130-675(-)|eukprot:CAMPEP_0182429666 /NCGR_PEP_ID=MMETSP1167-20130531/32192_1 /TAXON_ID=2988 /ORGANISM="Mallomonas Sp, Strain CCMP3275" /LENGTH=181 /DNA_ID=CAMNT_0024613693 /DNA_START=189 /DNA_END=737 /DNA_ORIENTATION=-